MGLGDWKLKAGRRPPCRSSSHSRRLSQQCHCLPARNGPRPPWGLCGTPGIVEHEEEEPPDLLGSRIGTGFE